MNNAMKAKLYALMKYEGRQGAGLFRKVRDKKEILRLCAANSHVWFLTTGGDARLAKINGKVRTWKTQPNRIEVPLKYGLYEYASLSLEEALKLILVEVK